MVVVVVMIICGATVYVLIGANNYAVTGCYNLIFCHISVILHD